MIVPIRMQQALGGIGFGVSPIVHIPQTVLDGPEWTPIEVSRLLGFPLNMMISPDADNSIPNSRVEVLHIDVDLYSSNVGRYRSPLIPRGTVVIIRDDRKSLHMNCATALERFIEYKLKEIRQVKKKKAAGKQVDRKEQVDRLLNSAAFTEFFEMMKSAESLQDPISWANVVLPTEV